MEAPAAEYRSSGHGRQASALLVPVWLLRVPAGPKEQRVERVISRRQRDEEKVTIKQQANNHLHNVHAAAPAWSLYDPTGHDLQMEEPLGA